MSAIIYDAIKVAITDGDAIPSNRTQGKSNTGTYFLCSIKDWDFFKRFFPDDKPIIYSLCLKHLVSYKLSFINQFFHLRHLYNNNMDYFEDACDSLLNFKESIKVQFELRINDNRIFLKFKDNNDDVALLLRNIFYSKLTNIVFEIKKKSRIFYPEVNYDFEVNQNEMGDVKND